MTKSVYVFDVFPVSATTTVMVEDAPAVRAIGSEGFPDVTGTLFTVMVPEPVGVTIVEVTAFNTVSPEYVYVLVAKVKLEGEPERARFVRSEAEA